MAAIVTASDFVLDVNLTSKELEADAIAGWIDLYEQPFKEAILGVAFAALFDDGSDAPYDAILPYVKYILVRYIYWNIKRDTAYPDSIAGSMKPTPTGAIVISPSQNMVRNWNNMVDKLRALYAYLADNATTYPTFDESLVTPQYYQNNFGI